MPSLVFALPVAQMALCAGAAVGYAAAGDWKHALYWALAGGITGTVTLL